ncbi:MAG: hypothetical protein LBH46_03480, partial [Rickettsiales bacterium]|nr:hypothetical protein [Rickettsiales bacterium]
MELKIFSVNDLVLDTMVKKITLNGDEGRVTFLPNHIDYITTFKSGILTYFD